MRKAIAMALMVLFTAVFAGASDVTTTSHPNEVKTKTKTKTKTNTQKVLKNSHKGGKKSKKGDKGGDTTAPPK